MLLATGGTLKLTGPREGGGGGGGGLHSGRQLAVLPWKGVLLGLKGPFTPLIRPNGIC